MRSRISTSNSLCRLALMFLVLAFASSTYAVPPGATLLFEDNFETSFGNWTNAVSGDNRNWTHDTAGTPSAGTGPSSGSSGSSYYVYLETSYGEAYNAGDSAILLGPTFIPSGMFLQFDYHMHGATMGTLSVDVLSGGSWVNDVWTISGQQHISNAAAYTTANVDLSGYSASRVRFRATAVGGYQGDMAIDNVKLYNMPSGPVPPEFLSDPITKPAARQDQPYSDTLSADAIDGNGDALFFSKVSGPTWLNISVYGELAGTPDASDMGLNVFVVSVTDGTFTTDATLHIEVNDNSAPIVISTVDFEQGFDNWSNVSVGDNKDWTRYSGYTTSYNTGPSGGANGSGYYLYMETSSGSAYTAGDSAIFQSPVISGTNFHLTFQYHMFGSNTGTLAVDVLTPSGWINDVWSISGQQHTNSTAAYADADVSLDAYNISQVRFRATAAGGYMGDIAIDNIVIESHPSGPTAPLFMEDPISKPNATLGQAYNDSIAMNAHDANGDPLTFNKVSGPLWLNVAADGTLTGTPATSDFGPNSFIVEVSDGFFYSKAKLHINVVDQSTPTVLSTTDFEINTGSWKNTSGSDNNNWTRNSGGTASVGTGPSQGANGSSYYMYVETSSGSAYNAGDTAILEGPVINNGSNIHLTFQYHMFGTNIGTLAVDVFDGYSWLNDVWSITGQQHMGNTDAYTMVDVDLSTYTVAQIRLRVTAAGGYTGDIAVDNLEITGSGTISPSSKIVFLTSQGYSGKLGGLAGADAICQSEAAANGLPGTFKAFLSDNNTSAADRLTHSSVPYETVNGTRIADNWADLVDGWIDNAFEKISGSTSVGYAWTGSDRDGTKATYYPSDYPAGYQLDLTCNNWSMDTNSLHYLGARGKVDDPTAWADWWERDGSSCSSSLALYCIEQ